MSNPAAAPVAALTFVGVLIVFLGVFAGGAELIALGVAALFGAGLVGALSARRA